MGCDILEILDKIKFNVKKKAVVNFLEKSDPQKIIKIGEGKLIHAFQNVAKRVPAYKRILSRMGVDYTKIKNLEDFKNQVPILVKKDIFPKFEIAELCLEGNLDGVKSAFTSSGHSKVFSYGVYMDDSHIRQEQMLDVLLDYFLGEGKKLLINSLAMGVNFSSSYPIFNTSVKSDMVIALIKKFHENYNQIVIFADPYFAKEILEEGIAKGIDWKTLNISLVLGGEWYSNSLSQYLLNLLGTKDQKSKGGFIIGTLGSSELGMNLFSSSPKLEQIRNLAQKDEELRTAIFGSSIKACPELMYYYPMKTFIEVANKNKEGYGDLVFSILNEKVKMPLIRYNSDDVGKLIDSNEIKEILIRHGHLDLIPEFRLPLAAIDGRKSDCVKYRDQKIYAKDINQAIYKNTEIVNKITGYFKISKRKLLLEVQLKKGIELDRKIAVAIQKSIFNLIGINIQVKVYQYKDFPYGMKLDYESKFRFVD